MKRYLILLMGLVIRFAVQAQTDDYNPINPPDPEWPQADTTTYYRVVCRSIPDGAGSFGGISDGYRQGANVSLYAYTHDNCNFICWKDANGVELSSTNSYSFKMPAHDVTVYAVYEYVPSSPGDPVFSRNYPLTLVSEPAVAGTFNLSEPKMVKEGTTETLYAYTNNGFRFLRWETENGEVLGTGTRINFLMPSAATTIKGIYEYAPSVPINPAVNSWDGLAGQAIVDCFSPGNLTSTLRGLVPNASELTHLIVDGQVTDNDMSFTGTYKNCTYVDMSRIAGISNVPSYIFDGYSNLKEIELPASITSIGRYAFRNCSLLKAFDIYSTVPPTVTAGAFEGVPSEMIVYVPEASVELYQADEFWGAFAVVPLKSKISSLELKLPADCSDGRYRNMSLELVNVKNGQKFRYVITDRLGYTFSTLVRNTTWKASLKNLSGQLIGESNVILIDDANVSYTFSYLKSLKSITLKVLDAGGNDVTDATSVTWTDASGTYLSQGNSLGSQLEGYKVGYSIALSRELGMKYLQPAPTVYTVNDGSNDIVVNLDEIPVYQLKGTVVNNMTGVGIHGASVSVTQLISGKYSSAMTVQTDANGAFSASVLRAPTTVTVSSDECVNTSFRLEDDSFADNVSTMTVDCGETRLKPISGVVINLSYTFRQSVEDGADAEVLPYYSDYANVSYRLYDKTQGKEITSFSVQYPDIVVMDDVMTGDELELTCVSKQRSFTDVTVSGTVDSNNRLSLTIPVVELGGINARFLITDNTAVNGILYDSKGLLVSNSLYSGNNLSITGLADGDYTLITMGQSAYFNSIFSLENLSEAGMTEGVDYLRNNVTVRSGNLVSLRNVVVPLFDESKYYYTGRNTSFSVNKANVIAGNYLTLSGKVDFLDAWKKDVTDVEMLIRLPESCSMVENSAILGNSLTPYEYRDNTVTIPLGENWTDRVKFCIVPSERGNFMPSAFVRFNLKGKTILQPIGSAAYTVTDMTIWSAPLISLPTISVDGNAAGQSQVVVYDGQKVIGTTKALADGYWSLQADLGQCHNMSIHEIWAEVTAPSGFTAQTETRFVEYNERSIQAKTVEMSFYNNLIGVNRTIWVGFDLEHIKASSPSYMFAGGTDFVFTADLTNNDPEVVNSCVIRVFTNKHEWIELPARYIPTLDRWVGVGRFDTQSMPIGVRVTVDADISTDIDYSEFEQITEQITAAVTEQQDYAESYQNFPETDNSYVVTPDIPEQIPETIADVQITVGFDQVEECAQEETVVTVEYDTDQQSQQPQTVTVDFADWNCNNYQFYQVPAQGIETVTYTADTIEWSTDQPNGEPVQVYYSEDGSFVVFDQTCDLAWGVDVKAPAQDNGNPVSNRVAIGHQGRIATELVDSIKAEIRNLETAARLVNGFINTTAEPIRHQLADIDNSLNTARELTGTLLAYKDAHPEESATVNAKIDALNADVAKLKKNRYELVTALNEVTGYISIVRDINRLISYGHYAITDVNDWQVFIDRILPCDGWDDPEARALSWISEGLRDKHGQRYIAACRMASLAAAVITSVSQNNDGKPVISVIQGAVGDYLSKTATLLYRENKALSRNHIRKAKRDRNSYVNCNYADLEVIEDKWDFSLPYPIVEPIIDPSGYVYEGVSSNRIEGVTATAYYQHTYEDMYGDLHQETVLWDATMYGQENPLYTDEQGMYQWDVPQGLWQVKFEKEGYQTVTTDWLPVPPPQMDVNIGMVQNAQPEVVKVRAFEPSQGNPGGVEVTFSKYMNPETLTSDNIYIKVIRDTVSMFRDIAGISYPDIEESVKGSGISYASRVSVDIDSLDLFDEVYLIINRDVESYSGITMAGTFEQKLDIEKRITSIGVDSVAWVGYGQKAILNIGALPTSAAAGKRVTVRSAQAMIAGLGQNGTDDVIEVVLDADGQAQVEVSGALFGTTALQYSIASEDVKASTIVSVVDSKSLEEVKAPVASRISGTALYSGQTVTLSCETQDAVIYYTLDGSCPCESDNPILYQGPIAITDATTIKAMAVGVNGSESLIAEYSYSVRNSSVRMTIEEGWNWVSTDLSAPLEATQLDGVAQLIRTSDADITSENGQFESGITVADATVSFKVKADAPAVRMFQGSQYNPSLTPIALSRGWNWLGYPIDAVMTLDDALKYLDVDEGDLITSLTGGFALYQNGEWHGELKVLTPGNGYMYRSMSSKAFVYNTIPTVNAQALYSGQSKTECGPWRVNQHRYADLMPVMAVLMDGDSEADLNGWYIAAFDSTECRGVGAVIDDIVYMTVYGNQGETLSFAAIDASTGNRYEITETVQIGLNEKGNPDNPFVLNLTVPTGVVHPEAENSDSRIYNIKGQPAESTGKSGLYVIDGQVRFVK